MCNMICNYEFVNEWRLWYYDICRSRNFMSMSQYRFLFALHLHLSLVYVHYYSSRKWDIGPSIQKYHLAKIPPIPKGFAYEKGVPVWKGGSYFYLKQCAVASFATRQGSCRKNSVFFLQKIGCLFVGVVFLKGGLCLLTLSRSSLIKSKHWKGDCFKFRLFQFE